MTEQWGIIIVPQIDKAQAEKTIEKELNAVSKVLPAIDVNIKADKSVKDLKKIMVDASSVVQSFNNDGKLMKQTMTGIDDETKQTVKIMQQFNTETGKLSNTFVTLSSHTGKTDEDFDKLSKRMTDLKDKGNSLIEVMSHYGNKEQIAQAKGLNSQLQGMTDISKKGVGEADTLARRISNLSTQVKASGKNALNFSEAWKSAFRSFSLYSSVTVFWYSVVRAIKSGIDQVTQLDTAMVELQRVTDETTQEMDKFKTSSFETAKNLSTTATEVIKATSAFARMGFELSKASELAESSIILKNIGDGINTIEESTDALIATLKGFQMDASQSGKIIDSLNEVSNKFALNTSDIAEGVRRVSGTLSQANTDLDHTTGLLTGGIEVLQNTEKVSSGLITVSQRLRGVSEEGENLKPTLEKAFRTLYGKSIMDAQGNLKSTYELLEIMATQSNNLTDAQKQWVFELAAGKRQVPVLQAIVSNWKNVEKATMTSVNSMGSARKEMDLYQASIEGRLQKTQGQIQEFWSTFINSDLVKTAITSFGDLVELASNLNKTLSSLPIILISISEAFLLLKGSQIAQYFTTLTITTGTFATSVIGLQVALGGLSLVLVGIAGWWQNYKKDIEEAKKSQEDFKQATEELNKTLSSGEKTDVTSRLNSLVKLQEEYAYTQKRLSDLKQAYNELIKDGINPHSAKVKELVEAQSNLKQSLLEIELNMKKQGVTSETLSKTIEKLRGRLDGLNESANTFVKGIYDAATAEEFLNYAMKEFANNGSLSSDAVDLLIEKFPELAKQMGITTKSVDLYADQFKNLSEDQARLQKYVTDETIKNVKARILAYEKELVALSTVINTSIKFGFEDALTEKKYLKISQFIEESQTQLKDLQLQSTALTKIIDTKTGSSSKDVVTLLTSEEIALNKINREISVLESSNNTAIDQEEKLKVLYNQKLISLSLLANSYREQLKTLNPLSEEYDSLSNKINGLSVEYNNLEKQILDTDKVLAESQLKAQEDVLDKLAKAYEASYERETKKKKENLESQIDDIDDALDRIKDEYDAFNNELEKDDINEKLSNLAKERIMQEVIGNLDSKARIAEIDEESADLKKELDKQLRKEQYESDKKALEEQKKALNKEIDEDEKAYKERIDNFEAYAEARKTLEEENIQDIIDILKEYNTDFAQDGLTKGQSWYAEFAKQIQLAKDAIAAVQDDLASIDIPTTSSGSSSGSSSSGKSSSKSSGDTGGKSLIIENTSSGSRAAITRKTFETLPKSTRDKYKIIKSYKIGGYIDKDQIASLHANEGVINQEMSSKIGSQFGMNNLTPKMLVDIGKGNMTVDKSSSISSPTNVKMNISGVTIANNMDIDSFGKKLAVATKNNLNNAGVRTV